MGEGTASPLTRFVFDFPEPLDPGAHTGASREGGKLYIPAIMRLEDASADVPDFVYEYARRGDLVLVSVPQERLEEVLSAPGVLRMESGICASPAMDLARRFCGLDEVYSAGAAHSGFSGKGVVVGFTDLGFDPNHINFIGPDGQSRVRRLVDYSVAEPAPLRLLSAGDIAGWSTDDAQNWHATHVAGILAGGYKGNDFYGVAPEADIVATTSGLHEAHLLAGIEEVVDYARSVQAPVPVVNMSISSSLGPHDGTSLFNRYLERLSEDAMVCISAGNDGGKWGGFFRYSHTSGKPRVQAFCREYPIYSPHRVSGVVDMWSMDSRPLALKVLVYDSDTKEVVHTFPTVDIAAGRNTVRLMTPDYDADNADADFSRLFASGYVTVSCEVNPENGRYNATMAFDVTNPGDLTNHWIGVEVEGAPGTEAEVFASAGINFMLSGNELSADCSNRRSINDLACGAGPAVVGSLTSRSSEGGLMAPLTVSGFGSFSTLRDGRVLPSFCAPGGGIISSVSGPWALQSGEDLRNMVQAAEGGRTCYWMESSGTSMSSPYAAGVFALWLEANPYLTPAEILATACATAQPAPDSDVRWGGGVLDAYAGLKKVLAAGSLASPRREAPVEIISQANGCVEVRGCTQLISVVDVYDLSGRCLLHESPGRAEWRGDLSVFPPGVYVVKARASVESAVGKIVVR